MKGPIKKLKKILDSEKESKNIYRKPTKVPIKYKDLKRMEE